MGSRTAELEKGISIVSVEGRALADAHFRAEARVRPDASCSSWNR